MKASLWWHAVKADMFAYVEGTMLELLMDGPEYLDILLLTYRVPTKTGSLKAMTLEDKRRAVKAIVVAHKNQPGAITYGLHELEITAILLRKALRELDASGKLARMIWFSVETEADLVKPVAYHFRGKGYDVYREIPMGRKRVDILCRKAVGGLLAPDELIAIELKNNLKELERATDQLTTFADYANYVYMACTADIAFQYLEAHANARGVLKWDPKALENKLRHAGIGLLVIVKEREVVEVLRARHSTVKMEKRAELEAHTNSRNIV